MFAVVYREFLWNSEPAYDVLLENFLNCFGGNVYQGLSFDPFGEVFNGHHCVFIISLCYGQRAYKVHSPPLEGPSGAISCKGPECPFDFGLSFWQASQVLTTSFASFSADGQKKSCLNALAARGLMPMWDPQMPAWISFRSSMP